MNAAIDFSRLSRRADTDSSGAGAHGRHAAILAQVLAVLGDCGAPLNVADIGCGDGAQSRMWAAHGHCVFGADIDPQKVGLAREKACAGVHEMVFDVASAGALPWPDRSMDVVLAPERLEEGADWRACLAEMVRVLRPGGVLYLSAANSARPAHGWLAPYGLGACLAHHGLASLEHVDLAGVGAQGRARRAAFALLRAVPPLRFCTRLAAPPNSLLAFKAA